MDITGKTTLTGIFGDPVEHSFSPAMHNAAFHALGMNWCYVPFHVTPERLGEAVAGIRALKLRGVNVTVPHKEAVMKHLDHVDEQARLIGAVNTIVNEEGVLTGYNTDGAGFVRSLDEAGIGVAGARVAVLGAGGASRAVCFSLLQAGVSALNIVNRTLEKAVRLSRELNAVRAVAEASDKMENPEGIDLLVNTTSLGLRPEDPAPADVSLLESGVAVCDLIYNPPETPLLKGARLRGASTLNGLGMLIWQGAIAFELWTDRKAPVEVMKKALSGDTG